MSSLGGRVRPRLQRTSGVPRRTRTWAAMTWPERGCGGHRGLGKQRDGNDSMEEFSGGVVAFSSAGENSFPLEAGHSGL